MNKLILMALVASATAIYQPAKAQVSVQINIGSQPNWGPSGYNHVDYYYLPEVQSYYYVPTKQFIYLERNKWVHRKSLPSRYRKYDLYNGRKIVINQPRPYLRHEYYRSNYFAQNNHYKNSRKIDYKHSKRQKTDHHFSSKSNNRAWNKGRH